MCPRSCPLALVVLLAPSRIALAQAAPPGAGDQEQTAASHSEDADATRGSPEGPAGGALPDGEGGEDLERPQGSRTRVAVLVLASAGVDPSTADALTELVIGAVAARGGVVIVGKEEFQATLGQGEARSIDCVTSTACLGRVGVELGVDELVAGTVGRRGDMWIFNINRIDIRTGSVAGRTFREVEGDVGSLAESIQDAIPALYEERRRSATLLVSSNVPGAEVSVDGVMLGVFRDEAVRLDDVSPGRHEVRVGAPGYFEWSRTLQLADSVTLQIDASLEAIQVREGGLSPLLWVGAAVAAAATLGALYFGIASQQSPDGEQTRRAAIEFTDDRRGDALIANVAWAIAGAGALTALVGLVLSDFGEADGDGGVTLALSPRAGGAGLALRGGF